MDIFIASVDRILDKLCEEEIITDHLLTLVGSLFDDLMDSVQLRRTNNE